MKRLLLMRHGKSDWDADYPTDHERPLSRRGREAATVMGVVLARAGVVPDLAITSSALRARTTLELASRSGAWETEIQVAPALYGSSATGALEVAARAPDEVESLMLVGHEPTWSDVARLLTGGDVTVKTATVVGIDLPPAAWARLGSSRGSVAFVLQPKMFKSGWSHLP